MNADKEAQLYAKYPEIFRQKDLPMTQTCMCWGFDCGGGWYKLIDDLCAQIMFVCNLAAVEPPSASQVKEKYGMLRFYTDGVAGPELLDDVITSIISCAERRSCYTCEECGEMGKLHDDGWCVVKCDDCYKEYCERTGRTYNEEDYDNTETT